MKNEFAKRAGNRLRGFRPSIMDSLALICSTCFAHFNFGVIWFFFFLEKFDFKLV